MDGRYRKISKNVADILYHCKLFSTIQGCEIEINKEKTEAMKREKHLHLRKNDEASIIIYY